MEEQKNYRVSGKELARLQVVHLGKITFNLQFLVFVIMASSVITFILPAIFYMMIFSIAALSLFTLFANPAFVNAWSGGEFFSQVALVMAQSWKYTVPIVAVLSVVTIVCLMFDKTKKHKGRIIASAIVCVLAFAVLFFELVNTGVFA